MVLARPSHRSLRIWRVFLGLMLVAALARLLTPAGDHTLIHFLAAAAVALVMTACAFMQGWIVALPTNRRLRAGGFALLLSIALGVTMGESFSGPGSVPIVGSRASSTAGEEDTEGVPYAFIVSPAIGDAIAMPMAFGLLYGITSALTLLFSLPAAGAYAQRAGEVRAFRALSALTLDPSQGLDRGRLAAAVARAPVEAGIARAAWVALADPSRGTLAPIVVSADGITVDAAARAVDAASLALDALGQSQPLVLTRAAADHRVRARPGDGIGSLLVLPLAAGGQNHGALFAARATPDAFDEDETAALQAFAGQAALALSHAALFDEALERERLARELALARDVQRRLVPEQLPAVRGASLSARMTSAHEVCGDYYDVADLGGECIGLLVADVAGKGAVAAFHMAQLKGIFQASAALSRSPGAFLARANEALRPSLGPRSFVSAVYAVLDPIAGTLTVARAGHCPAVLVRDGTAWPLRAPGLGLGLDAGPLFRKTLVEQVIPLHPGDVVAMYTDGLVEARDTEGAEFGYDRLNAALLASADDRGSDAARHVRDRLFSELNTFADPDAAVDDTTLVVLAWQGDGAATPARTDGPPFSLRPAFETAEV
jgi:serine phosphatase RsbU (regulator of sigma subunit)